MTFEYYSSFSDNAGGIGLLLTDLATLQLVKCNL